MLGRRWPLIVFAGVLALSVGCSRKTIDVVEEQSSKSGDFGERALFEAVETFSKAPSSAAAYRDFRQTVEELRPRFNERLTAMAELKLAFLAVGPLEDAATRTKAEELELLATTLWPVVFHVEPEDGEKPREFVERICAAELALECKYIVPEYWPLMLSAKAWKRFKERAREAYSSCQRCQEDPSYKRVLERFDQYDTDVSAQAKLAEFRAHPRQWPEAGENASPRGDAALLAQIDGTIEFGGLELEGSEWRRAVAAKRGDATVLAIHLPPDESVLRLRGLINAAASIGFEEVALIARDAAYPYTVREYHLRTSGSAHRLRVRDSDTIQVLVQSMDAALGGTKGELALSLPKRQR